jgi:opacity protein-like surface antigen
MRVPARFQGVVLLLAVLSAAAPATAQAPAGPPPPSGEARSDDPAAHELLPDIGRIGAEVGLLGGASWNPFRAGRGSVWGGFVDLPLARAPHGKLSYEIRITLSRGTSEPFAITDPIAIVANLASGATAADAAAGAPRAPFPVHRLVRSQIRLLQVSPFALKYTMQSPTQVRLRPFVTAGFDIAVVITRELPERDESLVFTGTSPFDDPLIGGLVAQAPELAERGIPTGQGNVEVGGHAAAGFELRISRGLSLNAEYRYARIGGRNGRMQAATGALGFHF